MAWNRSDNSTQSTKQSDSRAVGKSRNISHGLLAGLLVAALGGAAVWWLGKASAPAPVETTRKSPSAIAEVKSDATTNAPIVQKKRPKFPGAPLDWDKPYPPKAYWPDGRLKAHSRYVKVITNKVSEANMTIEELTFSNHAERAIAMLTNLRPGESLVGGGPSYGKAFVKQFKKSLETPIVLSDTDTPAQTELKKAVIELKKELKTRMDAGEDVAKIMNDAYAENRELSLYRQELEDQVARIRKEKRGEFSDADIKDLMGAANKMLTDRGAVPLRATKLFEMRMRLKAARANRAETNKSGATKK